MCACANGPTNPPTKGSAFGGGEGATSLTAGSVTGEVGEGKWDARYLLGDSGGDRDGTEVAKGIVGWKNVVGGWCLF